MKRIDKSLRQRPSSASQGGADLKQELGNWRKEKEERLKKEVEAKDAQSRKEKERYHKKLLQDREKKRELVEEFRYQKEM